jgi:DNA-binding beta-propeller fold protein YncE
MTRRQLPAGLGVLLVLIVLTSCAPGPHPTATPKATDLASPSLAPSPPPAGRIIRTIPVTVNLLGALSLAEGDGSIWVAVSGFPNGRVLRIDAQSGRQIAEIPVGWAPAGLIVVGNEVWVADTIGDGSQATAKQNLVEVIDAQRNAVVRHYEVPVPEDIAVLDGATWVVSADGSDHSTIRRLAGIGIQSQSYTLPEPGATKLVVASDQLWAATWSGPDTHLWGIDVARAQIPTPISVGGNVTALATDGSDLYLAGSPASGVVSKMSTASLTIVATSRSFDALQEIGANSSAVWVATGLAELYEVSPDHLADVGRLADLGGTPSQLLASDRVWVMTDAGLVEVEPTP